MEHTERPAPLDMHGRVELRDFILRILDERDKRYSQLADEREKRYEQRHEADQEAVSAALQAAKEAVTVAAEQTKLWQSASNEWRGAMQDRERMFLPRPEYDAAHKQVTDRLDEITRQVIANMSRQEIEAQFKALREQIDQQMKWLSHNEGREGVLHQGTLYMIGAITVLVSVAAIVVALVR